MLSPKKDCPTRDDLCNIENDIKRWQGWLKCLAELRQGYTSEELTRRGQKGLERSIMRAEEMKKKLEAQKKLDMPAFPETRK